jgi:hypothetical protein
MDPVPKDVTCWSPPILQATDQAVSHSAYACQDAETYAGRNPYVNSVDTSKGPILCSAPWELGISYCVGYPFHFCPSR